MPPRGKPSVIQEASRKAAYGLRDNQELYISGLYGQAGFKLYTNDSPVDINSTNVEEVIAELGEKFDENNFPSDGRFAIIPPWLHTKMFLAAVTSKTQNDVLYANGQVGVVNNINFIMSNNISKKQRCLG